MIASGMLALMAAATSCDKYDIYPEQYGDVLMIKDAGEKEVTIYATDDAADYYVSVMKGGHTPGEEGHAILRVMTPDDFKAYKNKMYGDPDFPGLDYLNPEFYSLADANGNPISGTEVRHTFASESDRYFGVNVVFNAQKISDWYEANGEDNSKNYVVPIGLYSDTDSVNADNQAIVIQPKVENPVMTINVEHNAYHVTEISRTKLLTDESFRSEHLKPEVYLEIPCKNPYGFRAKFSTENNYVSDFNNSQSKVSLSNLRRIVVDKETNDTTIFYQVGVPKADDPSKYETFIDFPPGVTKVRFPIEFYTENIDAQDLTNTWVRGFQFRPVVSGVRGYDMEWADSVPDKVKKSLKLPSVINDTYTFFIGYKVVETPVELTDGIVTSNDCEPTEGSIAALFDKDLSTFFHSKWTVVPERSAPFGSYLEIDCTTFPEEYNACYFQFTSRSNNNPMSPKEVHIYYSNETDDDARANNTNAWTLMKDGKLELKKKLGTSQVGEIGTLAKPIVTQNYETYKFLRFCVIKNSDDKSLFTADKGIYWNLAELVMYGKYIDPNATAAE